MVKLWQGRRRAVLYVWAGPTSAVGLIFLPFVRLSGGGYQTVDGVLELHGGLVKLFLERCTLLPGGASAMTLGHVVLGRDRRALSRTRRHERVHVRQVERWGPLFLPAYVLASGYIWAGRMLGLMPAGMDAYGDNPFEREAYAEAP